MCRHLDQLTNYALDAVYEAENLYKSDLAASAGASADVPVVLWCVLSGGVDIAG